MSSDADAMARTINAGKDDTQIRFRQGIIRFWDSDTGANEIEVDGTNLQNLATMVGIEALNLAEGHVVGLLRVRGSYFILGRIALPGSDDYADVQIGNNELAEPVGFTGVSGQRDDYGINTAEDSSNVIKIRETLNIPDWPDRVLISAYGTASFGNQSDNQDYGRLRVGVLWNNDDDTVNGGTQYNQIDAGDWGHVAGSVQTTIDDPPTDIDVAVAIYSDSENFGRHSANLVTINATAIYQRVAN